MEIISTHLSWTSSSRGGSGEGAEPPRDLADQLTLFKPRGEDYAPHTTASPPDSKSYLHLFKGTRPARPFRLQPFEPTLNLNVVAILKF